MLGEFCKQFEKLLYSNPLAYVDAMPLVLKFVQGMDDNKEGNFRVDANNYFRSLEREGFIVSHINNGSRMFGRIGGQPRSTEPVLFKSTDKFIRYYEEKNRPVSTNVTNYNTTHGHNSPIAGHDVNIGDINQSTSLDLRFDQNSPNNEPNQKAVRFPAIRIM